MNWSGEFSPWPNQSWFSIWIQQAASTLRLVAGLKVSRFKRRRLTSLGLGSISRGIGSGAVASGGALRPKRLPTMPISGSAGSWYEPS